ncbi:MAG TPA: hypothetical protein H9829_09660, partial [Candidatus Tetragenococcus pullicola]|nr:hypothetical protein [Candidatus Tetragenococcus pullicola]
LILEEGVKKYRRETATTIQFYVVNLGENAAGYELQGSATEKLSDKKISGNYTLKPYEYQILEIKK